MKTTIAGIVYSVAKGLQVYQGGPAWLTLLGQVLEAVAIGLGFVVAKDFNKTGAK